MFWKSVFCPGKLFFLSLCLVSEQKLLRDKPETKRIKRLCYSAGRCMYMSGDLEILTRCTVNFRYLFIWVVPFFFTISKIPAWTYSFIHEHHPSWMCSDIQADSLCCLTFFCKWVFYNINKVEGISTATVCSTILIKCVMLEAVIDSVWYNASTYIQEWSNEMDVPYNSVDEWHVSVMWSITRYKM